MSKIIEGLKSGEVLIKFKSLRSGRIITEKCSLNSDLVPKQYSFKQNNESDSLLCYLTEKERWEDIQKDSIVEYKIISEEKL